MGGREAESGAGDGGRLHISLVPGPQSIGSRPTAMAATRSHREDNVGSVKVTQEVWVHEDGIDLADQVSENVSVWFVENAQTNSCRALLRSRPDFRQKLNHTRLKEMIPSYSTYRCQIDNHVEAVSSLML